MSRPAETTSEPTRGAVEEVPARPPATHPGWLPGTPPGALAVLAVLALAAFLLAFCSTVRYEDSDPALLLVAAQALAEHGTLSLEPYRDDPRLAYDLETDRRVVRKAGSHRYRSIGTAILVVPIVLLCNRWGLDMLDADTEQSTQNLLSALSCATLVVLCFLLARALLPPWHALGVAAVFFFGSSLLSTLGSALWNTHFLVLPATLLLLHLTRVDLGHLPRPSPLVVATLLAVAVAARPTGILVLALVVTFELARRRRLAWLLAGVGLVGVVWLLAARWPRLFVFLPSYYSPTRALPETALSRGLAGTWLSPSRGLLVYSPFLLPVLAAVVTARRALLRRPLAWGTAAWLVLQLLLLATKQAWWGGHSYGPRLATELLPGFLVLAAVAWTELPSRSRRIAAGWFLALALPAVVLHSWIGLYRPAVRTWNEVPNIDVYPALLFDWRYPQFLASEASIARRHEALQRTTWRDYAIGETLGPDSPEALFLHWYASERGWRWSWGQRAEIGLRLAETPVEPALLLILEASALGRQSVTVGLNGRRLGVWRLDGTGPQEWRASIPPGLLVAGENRIGFDIPGARPAGRDPRQMGLALRSLRIEPAAELGRLGS